GLLRTSRQVVSLEVCRAEIEKAFGIYQIFCSSGCIKIDSHLGVSGVCKTSKCPYSSEFYLRRKFVRHSQFSSYISLAYTAERLLYKIATHTGIYVKKSHFCSMVNFCKVSTEFCLEPRQAQQV